MARVTVLVSLLLAGFAAGQDLFAAFEVSRAVEAAIDAGSPGKAAGVLDEEKLRILAANRDETWLFLKRVSDDAFWLAYCEEPR